MNSVDVLIGRKILQNLKMGQSLLRTPTTSIKKLNRTFFKMEIIERKLQNLTISTVYINLPINEPASDKAGYLVVTLVLLVLFYFLAKIVYRKQQNCGSEKNGTFGLEIISGPKPFFISFIGSAYHFLPLKETLNKTLSWQKRYGSCMKGIGVNHTALLIFSAEIAQTFLKSGDLGHVSKESMPFYEIMRPFLGNGILIAEGLHWQTRRKVLMKSMSFQSLRSYTKILNKHSKRFVNSLEKLFEDNVEHPINVQINCSFLAIITEILTGSDVQDVHEVAEYHHNFQTWKECMLARIEKPWCLLDIFWRLHPKYRDHNEAVASMNSFAKRRLCEHKLRKGNETNGSVYKKHDKEADFNCNPEDCEKFQTTLDDLVNARISDAELVHEINTLASFA